MNVKVEEGFQFHLYNIEDYSNLLLGCPPVSLLDGLLLTNVLQCRLGKLRPFTFETTNIDRLIFPK